MRGRQIVSLMLTSLGLTWSATAWGATTQAPNWVGRDLFYDGKGPTVTLYSVGHHPLGLTCDPTWTAQAVDFAQSQARSRMAEFLGKAISTHGMSAAQSHRVRRVTVSSDDPESTATGPEGYAVETRDAHSGIRTQVTTPASLAGVSTSRAWYDAQTRTLYVLVAKVTQANDLPLKTFPRLKPSGGGDVRSAARAMQRACRVVR